ncbi:MAG: hypothetical protein ACI8RZ_005525 [Myxococcota bacterium]|jgi:hypothetical protein
MVIDMRFALTLLLSFLLSGPALAAPPPVVDAAAESQASQIRGMSDGDPVSRMRMLLASRELSDAALFALAATHPGLVEQLTGSTYRTAIDYIGSLPPPELHRVRQGETVIRTLRSMNSTERSIVEALCDANGVKFKKFQAMRVGPLEGRIYRVEMTSKGRKKSTVSSEIELAWPGTPERDEASRVVLSRYFNARPSQMSNTVLPLIDGSFEDSTGMAAGWELREALVLGPNVPVNNIDIDSRNAIDGRNSMRFHADKETRLFNMATQRITVVEGMTLRARAQIMTDNLRVEFQQRPTDVYLALSFLDIYGNPVAPPKRAVARLHSHTWELLEIVAAVPPGADLVQLELLSAMSGTAWFDGVTLELVK